VDRATAVDARSGQWVLYVFSDDAQRLRHAKGNPEEANTASDYPSDLPKFQLDQNLRNTKQIHVLAQRFTNNPTRSAGPDGAPVELVEVGDPDRAEKDVSRALHRLIREDGVSPRDMAVLTGRSRVRSQFGPDTSTIGTFAVTSNAFVEPDKSLLDTAWRFKGLERPAVILCELEDYLDNDALLHAAITRARLRLIVIGSSETIARMSTVDG
jgi:hypothetical protein